MSDTLWQTQRQAAMAIVGKLVCFAHQPDGPAYFCSLMDKHGMVELLGMAGRFAPHLFVLFNEQRALTIRRLEEMAWIDCDD